MNNTPTLMQSEEERAPWNEEEFREVVVGISQTLSTSVVINIPRKFDLENEDVLKQIVEENVILPSEAISNYSDEWCVDDFCVTL